MSVATSLISDIETAITTSGSARRIETLRRVTDLFLSNADRYDPDQVQIFDDVLGRMITHIEGRALAELSNRLAPVANAPLQVIRTLAMNDAIAVAGPVIENSICLSSSDLVTIASTKSQDHLLAISGRKQIDEAVTDVLVERGNTEVAKKVAVNQGARLSQTGYAKLVQRAEHDDDLTDLIGQRPDITPRLFLELLRKAKETVRARLLAAQPDRAEGLGEALDKASGELAKANAPRDYSSARRLMQPLHHDGKLNDETISQLARDKRFEDVAVALSLLCSTSLEIIDRLMHGTHVEALLIPCRVAELNWPTVKAVLQLNPHQRGLSEDKYELLKNDYQKLSNSTAQRIIRFWQVRSTTTAAASGLKAEMRT